MAARGNSPNQDLSSAVPLSEGGFPDSPDQPASLRRHSAKSRRRILTGMAARADHTSVLIRASVLLMEQKVIERDWVESMIANIYTTIDNLERYIGSGNTKYLLIAISVVILILLWRRRR